MSVFLDDSEKNNSGWVGVQSDAPALGSAPITYDEFFKAKQDAYQYGGPSVAAKHTALFDAYDEQIKRFDDWGVKDHNLSNPVARFIADRGLGSAAIEAFERNKAEFEARRKELAVKYPELAATNPIESVEERGRNISRQAIARADRANTYGPAGSGVAGFFSDAASGLLDPFNAPFLLLGPNAKQGGSLAYHFMHSAGVNAAMIAAQQPTVQSYNKELGLPYGWTEAAKEIAIGGIVGGGIDIGIRGAARTLRVARGKPAVGANPGMDASDPGWRGIFEGGKELPSREQFSAALHEAVKTLDPNDPIRLAAEGDDSKLVDHLYETRNRITDPEARAEIDKALADRNTVKALEAAGIPDDWTTMQALSQIFKHFDDPREPLPTVSADRKPTETFADHVQAQFDRLTPEAKQYVMDNGISMRAAALVAELVPSKTQYPAILEAIKESGFLATQDIRNLIASKTEKPQEASRALLHGGNAEHIGNLEKLRRVMEARPDYETGIMEYGIDMGDVMRALEDPSTEASKILAQTMRERKPDRFPARLLDAIERDGRAMVLERQERPLGRPEFDDPIKGAKQQIADIEAPATRALEEMTHNARLSQAGHEPSPQIDWATIPGAIDPRDVPVVVDMWSFVDQMKRQKEPQSLIEFIRANGGIRDEGGDIASTLGAYRNRPGLASKAGVKADEMARMAWDKGYLEGVERPDINALLNAIGEEHAGSKVYAAADRAYADDIAVARQMENDLAQLGIKDARSAADVERAITDINTKAARDAGVGSSEASIGKSLEDTFAQRAARDVVAEARQSLIAGRPVYIGDDVVNAVLNSAHDVFRLVPEGSFGGALERIDPLNDGSGEAVIHFRGIDGSSQGIIAHIDMITADTTRAAHFDMGDRSIIGTLDFSHSPERGVVGKRAEVLHEVLHALRFRNAIPDADFFVLVNHAESLRVLDMPISQFHDAIGLSPVSDQRTLREIYTNRYSKRIDAEEAMAQEAAAHFVELAHHGYWLKGELSPVQHIVDGITSGRYAGKEVLPYAQLDRQIGRSMRQDFEAAIAGRSDQDALGYYSALDRVLASFKPTDTVTAQTLAQRGVKASELQARGLDGLLERGGAKVQDLIAKASEPVKLNESVYRPRTKDFEQFDAGTGPVKWAPYSLDKGSNPTYRETVLSLPSNRAKDPARIAEINDRLRSGPLPSDEVERLAQERVAVRNAAGIQPDFQSGHWSEPNVIAHMRTSMQKDSAGRPVYHIDELQSDWGQKLRDGGVRDEAKIASLAEALEKERAAARAQSERVSQWSKDKQAELDNAVTIDDALNVQRKYATMPDDMKASRWDNVKRLEAELETARFTGSTGHPLVNSSDQWQTTALRRALRQAVDANADAVALPSGDTVLSYGMGGEADGMRYAYDKMYPKNLGNILKKIDPSIKPERVEHLINPATGQPSPNSKGHLVFPLTEKVKAALRDDGQPMFAVKGKDLEKAERDRHIEQHGAVPLVTPEELNARQINRPGVSESQSGAMGTGSPEPTTGRPEAGGPAGSSEGSTGELRAGLRPQDFRIDGYRGRVVDLTDELGRKARYYYAFGQNAQVSERLSGKALLNYIRATNNWSARAKLVEQSPGRWMIDDVRVRKDQQRGGVGTHFYDSIERDLGTTIRPSGMLTDDGYAFRQNRDPESVKWYRKVGEMWLSPKQLINWKVMTNKIAEDASSMKEIMDAVKQNEQINAHLASLPEESVTPQALDAMFAIKGKDALPIQDKISNMQDIRKRIESLPKEERRSLSDAYDMIVSPSGDNYVNYEIVPKGKSLRNWRGQNNSVGSFLVKPAQRLDATGVEVTNARLNSDLRRHGIGTMVYDAISKDMVDLGGVVPSPRDQLTDRAQAFWANHLGPDVAFAIRGKSDPGRTTYDIWKQAKTEHDDLHGDTEDWTSTHYDEMAKRDHRMQEAIARRESGRVRTEVDATEAQTKRLMTEAASIESRMMDEGKSATEIAKAIDDRFNSHTTAADIESGRTWWTVDTKQRPERITMPQGENADLVGRTYFKWTPERVQEITSLMKQGKTLDEIATDLSQKYNFEISKGAVHQAGYARGISALELSKQLDARQSMRDAGGNFRWTPERVQETVSLKAQGMTVPEIAAEMSVRHGTKIGDDAVKGVLYKRGVGTKFYWTPDLDAALFKMHTSGASENAMTSKLSAMAGTVLSAETVSRRAYLLGLAERKSGKRTNAAVDAVLKSDDIKGKTYPEIGQMIEAKTGAVLSREEIAGKLMRLRNEPQFALAGESGDILTSLRGDIERSRADEIAAQILELCKAA